MRTPPTVPQTSIEVDVPSGDGPTALPYPAPYGTDAERRAASQSFGWSALADLLRWKWFLVAVTVLAAGASVAVSLKLPVWYAATATVLPPESSGAGGIGALIGDLSPLASSVLGGGGTEDYTRYLAIINSRQTLETVADRFDLVDVYDLADEPYSRQKTLSELRENLSIEVDLEYEFLSITVFDQSPRRAAQIANFLVEELNRRNEALAVESAQRFRVYVQERYEEVELDLDSARQEMQAFQERYGVVELPATAQALIESAVTQRETIAGAEMQYEALLAQYGPENPDVQAAGQALAVARRSQEGLLEGRERLLPIPLRELPAAAREYARAYQELLVQQTLLESARPLYEQARFDEERDRTAVQVLDEAIPPARKARPKRSVIVVVVTLSSLLLGCLFVLAFGWLRRNRGHIAWALHAARR